jgi:outer membrane immunogenic protein
MRCALITAVAAFSTTALTQIGSAADLPRQAPLPLPYSSPWAGIYGGVFAGGHWSRDRWGSDDTNPTERFGPFDLSVNGFSGGALLGANIQQGKWVWGPELDAGFLTGSETFPARVLFPTNADIDSIESKLRWNAHARLRFGYDMGSWMPFLALGVAYANTRVTLTDSTVPPPLPTVQSISLNRIGYTFGGGVDWMFNPNWIARVEYLNDRYTAASFVLPVRGNSQHMELNSQTVRGALIYKFGNTAVMASAGPAPVLKASPAAQYATPWSGVYSGVFAGGHWSRDRWGSDETGPISQSGPIDLHVNGFSGGGLLGANVQQGKLVWGTEVDAGVLTGSETFVGPPGPDLDTLETKLRWNAHARLRYGYDMGSWMPFLAAGVAYANTRVDINNPDSPIQTKSQSISLNRIGYTLGAGVDWMFLPNWIARVEYLYDRYTNAAFGAVSEIDSEFMGLHSNTVRGAIMYKFGDASTVVSSGPAPVFKAPPAVQYLRPWSGVYAGLFAGGYWSRDRWTSDTSSVREFGPFNLDVNGFSGGGLIGANFQFGNMVWGTEVDIGALTGSETLSSLPPPTFGDAEVASINTKMRWNAHARLRFGYDMGSWMPFLAGGVAYANTRVSLTGIPANIAFTGRPLSGSADIDRIGYTIGGGLDWMFNPNWIARVEYLYDRYATASFAIPVVDDSHHLELQSHTLRGALVYKFGPP